MVHNVIVLNTFLSKKIRRISLICLMNICTWSCYQSNIQKINEDNKSSKSSDSSNSVQTSSNDINSCPNHYDVQVLFNKQEGPCTNPDDPYQVRPTSLSERFMEKYGGVENPSTIVLGDYKMFNDKCIGNGDEGCVYLGQHISTGVYVAVKILWRTNRQTTIK